MGGHPSKTCVSCGRVIEWRRKWARDWDEVRYCSAACRRHKVTDADRALEAALRAALDRPGATVDPAGLGEREPARRAARRLAATGDFEILVAGRVADPSTAKGELRLRRR